MTYFNPLIAPVAQGPQAQRAAAADRERVARAQALARNSAAEGDRYEHTVESADALAPVGDNSSRGGDPREQQKHGGRHDEDGAPPTPVDPPQLDVTA